MRGWLNRSILFIIVVLTAFSVVTVWPSEPDRYLPDFVPWPEARSRSGQDQATIWVAEARAAWAWTARFSHIVMKPTSQAPDVNVDAGGGLASSDRVNAFGVAGRDQHRAAIGASVAGHRPREALELVGGRCSIREPKLDRREYHLPGHGYLQPTRLRRRHGNAL
jgi:hypothetical protein